MYKKLINPERLRQIPANFSWIDHRIVRQGYLKHLNPESTALYLFLVSVGDSQGLSYYSEIGISKLLTLESVSSCRRELLQADLISYANGVYQVLELSHVATFTKPQEVTPVKVASKKVPAIRTNLPTIDSRQSANEEIPECLKKLLEDLS